MNKSLLQITAILFLAVSTSFARLGETPDECAIRYGSSTGTAGQFTMYSKGHVTVAVLFRAGHSAQEIFAPEPFNVFSEDQIAEFLTANSEGATWIAAAGSGHWRVYWRSDKKARATLELTGTKSLSIEYMGSSSQYHEIEKKPSSDGF